MSLAEAMQRGQEGALWLTRRHSALARAAAAAGTPVLDGDDPSFGQVIRVLGRGVDLDAIEALAPGASGDAVDALLAAVNDLLWRAGSDVRCLPCAGLRDAPTSDVELAGLRLPRGAGWPRRFVAVDPRAPETRRAALAVGLDAARSVFVWLDWLLERSPLLAESAPRLRQRAAQAMFGVQP